MALARQKNKDYNDGIWTFTWPKQIVPKGLLLMNGRRGKRERDRERFCSVEADHRIQPERSKKDQIFIAYGELRESAAHHGIRFVDFSALMRILREKAGINDVDVTIFMSKTRFEHRAGFRDYLRRCGYNVVLLPRLARKNPGRSRSKRKSFRMAAASEFMKGRMAEDCRGARKIVFVGSSNAMAAMLSVMGGLRKEVFVAGLNPGIGNKLKKSVPPYRFINLSHFEDQLRMGGPKK